MPMVVTKRTDQGERVYLLPDRKNWTYFITIAAHWFELQEGFEEPRRLALYLGAFTREVPISVTHPEILPLSPVPQRPGVDLTRYD